MRHACCKALLTQRGEDQDHLRTIGGICCSAKGITDCVFAHFIEYLNWLERSLNVESLSVGTANFCIFVASFSNASTWKCMSPLDTVVLQTRPNFLKPWKRHRVHSELVRTDQLSDICHDSHHLLGLGKQYQDSALSKPKRFVSLYPVQFMY